MKSMKIPSMARPRVAAVAAIACAGVATAIVVAVQTTSTPTQASSPTTRTGADAAAVYAVTGCAEADGAVNVDVKRAGGSTGITDGTATVEDAAGTMLLSHTLTLNPLPLRAEAGFADYVRGGIPTQVVFSTGGETTTALLTDCTQDLPVIETAKAEPGITSNSSLAACKSLIKGVGWAPHMRKHGWTIKCVPSIMPGGNCPGCGEPFGSTDVGAKKVLIRYTDVSRSYMRSVVAKESYHAESFTMLTSATQRWFAHKLGEKSWLGGSYFNSPVEVWGAQEAECRGFGSVGSSWRSVPCSWITQSLHRAAAQRAKAAKLARKRAAKAKAKLDAAEKAWVAWLKSVAHSRYSCRVDTRRGYEQLLSCPGFGYTPVSVYMRTAAASLVKAHRARPSMASLGDVTPAQLAALEKAWIKHLDALAAAGCTVNYARGHEFWTWCPPTAPLTLIYTLPAPPLLNDHIVDAGRMGVTVA